MPRGRDQLLLSSGAPSSVDRPRFRELKRVDSQSSPSRVNDEETTPSVRTSHSDFYLRMP
jgi:hypothetical protein